MKFVVRLDKCLTGMAPACRIQTLVLTIFVYSGGRRSGLFPLQSAPTTISVAETLISSVELCVYAPIAVTSTCLGYILWCCDGTGFPPNRVSFCLLLLDVFAISDYDNKTKMTESPLRNLHIQQRQR